MGQPQPARRRTAMWTAFVATVMLGAVWGWTCFTSMWFTLPEAFGNFVGVGATRGSAAALLFDGAGYRAVQFGRAWLIRLKDEPEMGVRVVPAVERIGTSRMFTLPLWMPVAGAAGLTWYLWRGCRFGPGRCPSCGYSLAGLPGGAGCPECGTGPG